MNKIFKTISAALISFTLLPIGNVFAGTWIPHQGLGAFQNGVNLGGWEYLNDNETGATGWNYIDGKWYYFDYADGCAVEGIKTIDGKDYYFDYVNGDMKSNQWVKVGHGKMGIWNWAGESGSINYNECAIYQDGQFIRG